MHRPKYISFLSKRRTKTLPFGDSRYFLSNCCWRHFFTHLHFYLQKSNESCLHSGPPKPKVGTLKDSACHIFLRGLNQKHAPQPCQCKGCYSLCHNTGVLSSSWLLLMCVKCLGKRKHLMLHLRHLKMFSSCSSGDGLCVTELQLLSHLTYLMVSSLTLLRQANP